MSKKIISLCYKKPAEWFDYSTGFNVIAFLNAYLLSLEVVVSVEVTPFSVVVVVVVVSPFTVVETVVVEELLVVQAARAKIITKTSRRAIIFFMNISCLKKLI